MRYAYRDLGQRPAGTRVVVGLEGSSANVLLLDRQNYALYRAQRSFRYQGGLAVRSPTTLTVPRDGHWFLVVDLGRYGGRLRARIEQIIPPEAAERDAGREREAALETVG